MTQLALTKCLPFFFSLVEPNHEVSIWADFQLKFLFHCDFIYIVQWDSGKVIGFLLFYILAFTYSYFIAPRICILGPPASGKTTIVSMLFQCYNTVHLPFYFLPSSALVKVLF